MEIGAITSYIDVAQVVLYVFWLFFFSLVFYLRQEDKREGYPLEPDPAVPSDHFKRRMEGFPPLPKPKTFRMHDGRTQQAPRAGDHDPQVKAEPLEHWPGSPLVPTGNPMLDAVGPASYAQRPDHPEPALHGEPRFAPLRLAGDYSVASQDPDPRGMAVIGADGESGGTIADIWIDRSELQIRYFEVKVAGPEDKHVLLPFGFCRINGSRREVKVVSILSTQFIDVPATRNPDQVTQLEEDRIMAYYGSGHLYATPQRQEPLL
ncbi:MAG: photosynthetic reaction center subunit H [Gammaproteobacteria bacterium]|nr:photosynthetic reaction center subunit H [Gammaproteobacteria bacterium]MCY4358366.1 photosynthetic reaction center subunit H [Gammaproteobacteria bacterium]